MRRGMKAVGIVLLVIVALAACADDNEPSGGATPTPTSTTFTEAEWTIVTPAGWTKEDVTSTADAKKAIRYKGAAGEYLIVAIDPTGSDFSYDALWRYEVKDSGFEVAKKTTCTSATDESCSDKDQRFDGYVLWKSEAEPPSVGGHTWYFIFGDSDSTTVAEATYEAIVESVRVSG